MDGLALPWVDTERWLLSAAIVAAWGAGCWRWMRSGKSEGRAGEAEAGASILVAHASQTGTAERLALNTKRALDARGADSALIPLGQVTREHLARARTLIVFASTTGEGEAPDGARAVEQGLLGESLSLPDLEVHVMALGDRSYAQFCAFGTRVARWAEGCGARVSLSRVDDLSAEDLAKWDARMAANGLPGLSHGQADDVLEWSIDARDEIASGDTSAIADSRPGALVRVRMSPVSGAMPEYAVGDLFEWHGKGCGKGDGDGGVRRDFSIASVPGDSALELVVRRVELPGGRCGVASAALTLEAGGGRAMGRVRRFANFHETRGDGPLLVVSAGSGWGGVRAHAASAIRAGRAVWIIYGERGPASDQPIFDEMRAWERSGKVARLDLALSRAEAEGPSYVQDCVEELGPEIANFVGDDGAVAICGAALMGEAITQRLREALSEDWIESARAQGRWRSALY